MSSAWRNLSVFAFIPSPSSNAIHIGSLQLRAYGLMIASGVVAAVWLAGKRLAEAGAGTREDFSAIALWAVPAGVIGARLYHVVTDWSTFHGDYARMFEIWQGGLGIWGGVLAGTVAAWRVAKRRHLQVGAVLNAAAPALPLAQAIGRLGNWFNQELFGKPTTLPWAVRIDLAHRPAGLERFATYQPTFLYELIWNLLLCGTLLVIDRRCRLRPGRLFAMYVAGYTFARFFIERMRIGYATRLWGLRVNEWVAALVFVIAAGFMVVDAVLHSPKSAMVKSAPCNGQGPAGAAAESADV